MVSSGTDVYGGFPLSAPGGTYSVKVGNNSAPTPSTITTSFVVTNSAPILTYRYAMDILNYPHTASDAGRIVLDIFDNNNTAITCAHYEAFFSTSGGNQGFLISTQPQEGNSGGECCYDISYKPWTALSVDLSPYIGQTVTLKASCKWCIWNVDWAYAYFDFGCTNYQIKQDTTCNSVGALLIAPSDFQSYSWVGPGVVSGQANDSAYVNQTGSYTVNMTTATGCIISKTITVSFVPPVVTAAISGNTGVCDGGNITLLASGGGTYHWLNSSLTTAAMTINPITTTTYSVEVKDNFGCTDTAQATVVVFPLPTANFSFADVCLNEPVNFFDSSTVASGTITGRVYNFGDGTPINSALNPSHTFANAGTYLVSLAVISNNGCKDTIKKSVSIHPMPLAKFSKVNVCDGASVQFLDLSSVATPDNVQSWKWNFGDNSPVYSSQDTSHLYGSAGSYTVKLSVVSNFGCADSITGQVSINPNPVVNFKADDTVGCTPLCVSFQDLSTFAIGSHNVHWVWNVGDASPLNNSQNFDHCYTNTSVFSPALFTVTLTVTSDSGCVSTASKNSYITVYPNPNANFTVQPQKVTIMNPLIEISNLSTGATAWQWNFGDNTTSSTTNPLPHVYGDTGTYIIWLITSTDYGCYDTAFQKVIVDSDFAFYIPNAFTPDGDGKNDTFNGKGIFIKEYEMSIFDRWGNLIFFTDDINKPWDGKANHGNDIAQRDVYVYVVVVTDFKKKKHNYKGIVTLVR